jgi:beta-lactamase regulating signal transducer with metallopeptidase domain
LNRFGEKKMNEFMKILLSLSVSGTLLLLLILGLKPLYKSRFSKRWQYYIWIIVALRFLLPFTPDTTIVGSLFEKPGTTVITNEIPTSPNVPAPANTDNSKTEPIQADRDIAAAMREPFNRYVCLFFIWSVFALVLFVRKITIYQGFIQYIKAGSTEVSDIKTLNLLSDCEEKLNIKTRVELSRNPLIASPIMIGFFRARIVLPACELDDKELSYIFVHELIHYKQRDMFYKWLIQIVVCAHWFNPFVYLLEKEVNKSCELSCDEKVISILDDKARREYGDTLISFLQSNNLYKSSLASVTLTEGAEQLKERLGSIMKFKKKSKGIIAITAIFSVLVCVCFFVTGAYAASPATNNNLVLKDNGKPNEVSIKTESDRNIKETENKTEKTENQYSTEYAQHGITVTDGIYYYHGERVRIFMDLRMNGSFENFIFDNEGSIDLRVLRDKNNSITNVEYLTESEADELLYDMDEYSPDNQLEVPLEKEDSLDNSDVPLKDQNIGRSVRVTKEELSEELRDIISSCDTETWYVIKSAGYQYIYFGGLPYNYTFQPEIYTDRNSGTVNVFDMGTTTGNYVLLEIQQNVSLTINYNGTQISYTEL